MNVPNPFELNGPEFLLFYAVLVVVVIGASWYLNKRGPVTDAPKIDTGDPYLIAYLRGGPNESLRVCTAALADRGLLSVSTRTKSLPVLVARKHSATLATRPIEKAVVRHFADANVATSIFRNTELQEATAPYRSTLEDLGLLLDPAGRAARDLRVIISIGGLLAVAAIKLLVAISRGRSNVEFLLLGAVLVVFFGTRLLRPGDRTALGDRVLADLRRLFRDLRSRAHSLRPGGATNEAALLAGVFGLSSLSASRFDHIRQLYPKASAAAAMATWGTTCGSLSSGGGGCSSCGGGGCGGGCGGCGG